MLAEKESREDAISKYTQQKEKETVICPPTCTGVNIHSQKNVTVSGKEGDNCSDCIYLLELVNITDLMDDTIIPQEIHT